MAFENYLKLAKVFSYCNRFEGRKKIQKVIYILKEMGIPFEEKFDFHFYGPYSQELALEVEALSSLGILSESATDYGNWSQYDYSITSEGKKYAENCFDSQLKGLDSIVNILNNQTPKFLELVATIIYFKNLSRQEIVNKIHSLKADKNYSLSEIEEGFKFIKETCKISLS